MSTHIVGVKTRVIEMGERRSSNASATVDAGHVIENHVNDNLDPVRVAGGDHFRELRTRTTLALNLVGYSLIIGPPLSALDVFGGGTNCRKRTLVRPGRKGASLTLHVAVAS